MLEKSFFFGFFAYFHFTMRGSPTYIINILFVTLLPGSVGLGLHLPVLNLILVAGHIKPAVVFEWSKTVNSQIQVGNILLRPSFESSSGQVSTMVKIVIYCYYGPVHSYLILSYGATEVVASDALMTVARVRQVP